MPGKADKIYLFHFQANSFMSPSGGSLFLRVERSISETILIGLRRSGVSPPTSNNATRREIPPRMHKAAGNIMLTMTEQWVSQEWCYKECYNM